MGRCTGAFWLDGSPRATAKGFRHDVEVTGHPVRRAPYRLKGTDLQSFEKRVAEDIKAGQLIEAEGDEEWASPAFVIRYPKTRVVVEYRKVNAHMVRSTFLVSRADDQKARAPQAHLITMLDAASGFNRIRNFRGAMKVLAMVTRFSSLLSGLSSVWSFRWT
jgi:hypothetical protein